MKRLLQNLLRLSPLTPWATLAAAAVAILVVVTAVAMVLSWQHDRRAAGEARVGQALGEARTKSAADATNIVAEGADRDQATDAITRENAHAIDSAPGANQAVDPAAHRAGLVSLCKRAAYRGSAQCLQLTGPEELQDPRTRR